MLYDVAIIDWARGRHLIWVGSEDSLSWESEHPRSEMHVGRTNPETRRNGSENWDGRGTILCVTERSREDI